MSTIVEASIPAEQFALQDTIRRIPEVAFEAVRTVTDGADRAVPLLWSSGADPEAVTDALEDDESTERVELLTSHHQAALYRLEWTARVRIVTDLLVTERGAILSARARDGVWSFRVLFAEREAVAAIVEACDRYDIDLRIERIAPTSPSAHARQSDLTDEQFRTVQAALERGYYAVPRGTTLTELAEELGVSHQALSERLRRGHRRLVETALGDRIRLDSRS